MIIMRHALARARAAVAALVDAAGALDAWARAHGGSLGSGRGRGGLELEIRVAEAGADDAVRVLIVAGSGGSFCAGTDLADLANTPTSARGGSGGRRMGWPLIE